ncbi:MAG: hypothetical protein QE278_09610 [Limnobacter sp.]|nr:hypothetical protein [Limnobacter sp.]
MRKLKILMLLGTTGILSSCDLSQIPGLDKRLNIEDSKAIGAACRHSGRALEDCFTLNPLALQSGVFEGWRDMNDYMVANKIETVEPVIQSTHYKPGAKEESAGDHGPPEAAKAGVVPGVAAGVAPGGVGGASGGGSARAWSPGGAQPPAGEAAAGQGRPRWQPGQAGSGAAAAAPAAPMAPGAPSAGLAPPAQAGSPPAASEGSAAAPTPKSDSPARPWERKAGAKNTT